MSATQHNPPDIRPIRSDDLDAIVDIDSKHTGTARPEYLKQKLTEALDVSQGLVTSMVAEVDGQVVHLTMYGLHIDDALDRIESRNICIVVGAEKVPAEVYQMADINLAVGNQPHSEVAALAMVLDRLTGGEGLRQDFDGRLKIIPTERGKRVEGNTE